MNLAPSDKVTVRTASWQVPYTFRQPVDPHIPRVIDAVCGVDASSSREGRSSASTPSVPRARRTSSVSA